MKWCRTSMCFKNKTSLRTSESATHSASVVDCITHFISPGQPRYSSTSTQNHSPRNCRLLYWRILRLKRPICSSTALRPSENNTTEWHAALLCPLWVLHSLCSYCVGDIWPSLSRKPHHRSNQLTNRTQPSVTSFSSYSRVSFQPEVVHFNILYSVLVYQLNTGKGLRNLQRPLPGHSLLPEIIARTGAKWLPACPIHHSPVLTTLALHLRYHVRSHRLVPLLFVLPQYPLRSCVTVTPLHLDHL